MIASAANEVSVLHELPGRMRVHLCGWSGQGQGQLLRHLRQVLGVTRVEANTLTGNVLIVFDSQSVSRQALLKQLRVFPFDKSDEEPEHPPESLPPVVHEWPHGPVQRARIGVRGLDRNPRFAAKVVRRLEQHPGVRASAVPLTGHVLLECKACDTPLSELVAELAELELPAAPDEERPAHPLDPAPLTQAVVRTAGSVLGLSLIAARQLMGARDDPPGAKTAATVSAVIGLLRSFPTLRGGLRKLLGRNTADATFSLAAIASMTVAGSRLGLAVMGVEAFVLLREVLAQRKAWRRYEEHFGIAPETRAGAELRLECGDCVPVPALVLEGTGTVIHCDGLPIPVRPGAVAPAGGRLAGGLFRVWFQAAPQFLPRPRSTPYGLALWDHYLRFLGPASFAGSVHKTTW